MDCGINSSANSTSFMNGFNTVTLPDGNNTWTQTPNSFVSIMVQLLASSVYQGQQNAILYTPIAPVGALWQ